MTDAKSQPTPNSLGLLILAGIGAGTLIGATVGLMLGRRSGHEGDAEMTESVDALKEKARQVLSELSDNVAGLREQAQMAGPDH